MRDDYRCPHSHCVKPVYQQSINITQYRYLPFAINSITSAKRYCNHACLFVGWFGGTVIMHVCLLVGSLIHLLDGSLHSLFIE